ncbi:MAG: sn-glycerol-3-phosphate ABC transporter ATP-binding protein UgpC [Alphaproteobacteria bacterium]|nr:sn-glycerol-3-phosphate ABC transporter ATP-binding protein UgpC [Alphaproteobacteria bacterium]
MAEITIRDLVKTFGEVDVIKGISLDIHDGEFVVIVGPSGCGKSTLLRLLAGLEDHPAEAIAIDRRDLAPLSPGERQVAMVFQSYALYPHKTVRENIAFPLRMIGLSKAEIVKKVDEAARILQIDHLLERKPGQLSGGQKQRVAIGRAIVRSPKVFLFDEPLSNLDADLRGQMRAEIVRLHRALGATMIYVTHDQIEAMTMADRIVVLRDGIVEQIGAPLEIYNRPANKFVASFIGSPKMNFIDCAVGDSGGGELALAGGAARTAIPAEEARRNAGARTAGIRPDAVAAGRKEEGAINASMAVSRVELLGSRTRYSGDLGSAGDFTIELPGPPAVAEGDRIDFHFPLSAIHFFAESGKRI